MGGAKAVATPQLTAGERRAIIGPIVITMMFNGFTVTLMSVALPAVARTCQVTVAQANWIVLAFAIVAATVITMGARFLHR